MPTFSQRVSIIVVSVIASFLLSSVPAYARAENVVHPQFAKGKSHCYKLRVHFNGKNAPSIKCVQFSPPAKNAPNLHQDDPCGNDLDVFIDAYQSGDEICFSGAGFANLTDFCYYYGPFCLSWNDVATSWTSHSQTGKFYVDTNGNGTSMRYGSNSLGNFTSNPIPNDSLSSLCIDNGCPN